MTQAELEKKISLILFSQYGGNWEENHFVANEIMSLFQSHIREVIGEDEKMNWTAEFMEEGRNELRAELRKAFGLE